MAYSMTGIGRANSAIKSPAVKFDVEIKSYNHRFLEISVKAPGALQVFEDQIRNEIQKVVQRGHIVVTIQQDREILPGHFEVDKVLLDAYMKIVEELKSRYRISGEIDINTLLSIPGLVKFSQSCKYDSKLYEKFKPILAEAIKNFLSMKKKEGENIVKSIGESIKIIENCVKDIEEFIPTRNKYYKKHLEELIRKNKIKMDEARLYQEILYNVDRSDVTEECKRLSSHIELFKESLIGEDHPGRKLNFLLQEMQREANTLSVKANYLDISKMVIRIKEEVEKIREQVQNIE